jgi:hypothetical protein
MISGIVKCDPTSACHSNPNAVIRINSLQSGHFTEVPSEFGGICNSTPQLGQSPVSDRLPLSLDGGTVIDLRQCLHLPFRPADSTLSFNPLPQ